MSRGEGESSGQLPTYVQKCLVADVCEVGCGSVGALLNDLDGLGGELDGLFLHYLHIE